MGVWGYGGMGVWGYGGMGVWGYGGMGVWGYGKLFFPLVISKSGTGKLWQDVRTVGNKR